MVSWYYVEGTERVGPVDELKLKELFLKEEISLDTYVWKKGFPNWEKINSLEELKNFLMVEEKNNFTEESSNVNLEQSNLEIHELDWEILDYSEEKFFICIGGDRLNNQRKIFGPYSLIELREAFNQKRINSKTYLTALGLKEWVSLGSIPLFTTFFGKDRDFSLPMNISPPLFFITEANDQMNHFFMQKNDQGEFQFWGERLPNLNQEITGEIFSKLNSIALNIKFSVISVDKKSQSFIGKITENAAEVIKKINQNE